MRVAHTPIFKILGTIFFALQEQHVAPMGMKFGVEESRLTFPRQISPAPVQGLWDPQNWNFYLIPKYMNSSPGRILARFLRNFQRLWGVSCNEQSDLGLYCQGRRIVQAIRHRLSPITKYVRPATSAAASAVFRTFPSSR